ncbi:alpha/beta fold hydrolase [Mesorhizobium sp. ES1-4]|uniref:alpha/beta fold hydrolase n=1 Tax=Mesorhizobium sp. ES1-4 TaxID=2876627 RepID=UPI001CCCD251|nr:alpha/beta hydrolase [Mesorhizobium sp. ES1-4]MBZ9794287.1 alpha/beta hydrolase [Mesorhizobium sp. ES1-4]
MDYRDDDLTKFEAHGAAPLPDAADEGQVEHEGAKIWYATFGTGFPVILLHGGLGHSGNWGFQVPALVKHGYLVVTIDSRGHGRSTRDGRPYKYELMASDVLAVMDRLRLDKAIAVGWSDGACVALILGMKAADRIAGVFFFGCNMDPSGTKEFKASPVIERCFSRHKKDYAELSATPGQFDEFVEAVGLMMKTEPNYGLAELGEIRVPVAVVQSEQDEFIKDEHAAHLARSIPASELVMLPDVSHFAPLQRPERFNRALLAFLAKIHS